MVFSTLMMPLWLRKFARTSSGVFKPKNATSQFPKGFTKFQRLLTMAHLNYDNVLEPMMAEFMQSVENEHNWQNRHKLLKQLTGLLLKNKPEVPRNFWDKTKLMLHQIVAAAGSERTQLSGAACECLGAMFQTLGSQMHPYMEMILPTIIQISGSAKKLNQTNGHNAMTTIIQFSGYNSRLLYHICATFSDKRKDARAWAPVWMTHFVQVYEHSLDANKDYPVIEKALVAGLNDGDVKTREATRACFWQYSKINQTATDAIIETLNTHAANALRSDKNNPQKTTAPAKAARSESALAKIKAQKQLAVAAKAQATEQAQGKAKRDFSNTSTRSEPFVFPSFDRIHDKEPPKINVSPERREQLIKGHDRLVKLGIREKGMPIFDLGDRHARAPMPDYKQTPKDAKVLSTELNTNEKERRGFLSAPMRRPRVVATLMSHPQSTSRPASRGETGTKTEAKDRPQPGKSVRQNPLFTVEEGDPLYDAQHVRLPDVYPEPPKKSSARPEHKSAAGTSTSSRPSSSSSEPAGIKGSRGHTQQSASTSVLPNRHQKSSSTSEAKGHKSIASTTSSSDYSKSKTMPPPEPVDLPFTQPETLASSVASSNKSVDYSKLQPIPPLGSLILPLSGKENSPVPYYGKVTVHKRASQDELDKARRSLPNVIEVLKEGKLDTLGYRKLRKLITTYPGKLFTDGGVDDQYDALYKALISRFSSMEEVIEPREQRRANPNHPMYTRLAVIDMLHLLIVQYPYGEPVPGMTLVALLVARACYTDPPPNVDDKFRSAMMFFLNIVVERFDPHPVIDSVTDTLLELQAVIMSNEPQDVRTPTWEKVLDLTRPLHLFRKPMGSDPMSHMSDFGENPPKVPSRLPQIMDQGLIILTDLINAATDQGQILYEVQIQKLGELVTLAINTYRHLFKRTIMEFATALYDIIKPEQRFKAIFERESDLNLAYYCVGRVMEEQGRPMLVQREQKHEHEDYGEDLASWGTLGSRNEELATF